MSDERNQHPQNDSDPRRAHIPAGVPTADEFADIVDVAAEAVFPASVRRRGLAGVAVAGLLLGVGVDAGAATAQAAEGEVEKVAIARSLMKSDREEWDTAARLLQEFVRDHPADPVAPEALVLLGYARERLNQSADAADAYGRVLKEYPTARPELRQDALQGVAYANYRLGRFPEAADHYGRLIAQYPDSPKAADALLWRGEANYQQAQALAEKDKEGARDLFLLAKRDFAAYLDRNPDAKQTAAALASAGFAGFDGGDYEAAATYFSRFVREFPQDERAAECQYYVAESWYRRENYARARQEYETLLKPPFAFGTLGAEARAGMAWCDYAQGEIAKAALGFAEAADMEKRQPETALRYRFDSASAYREAEDWDAAAAQFAQVESLAPDRPIGARALYRHGALRVEQAKRIPADAAGAEAEKRQQLLRDGAELLRRAVQHPAIDDDALEAHLSLGEAALDLQSHELAAHAFGVVAQRWPNDPRASWASYHLALSRREIANQAAQRKDAAAEAQALAAARDALVGVYADEKEKLRLQAAYALAEYQNALGDKDAARQTYRWVAYQGQPWAAAWRDDKGNGDAVLLEAARRLARESLFRLGESHYADKDADAAATCYRQLVEQYPQDERAGMALLRLGELDEAAKNPAAAMARYGDAIEQGQSAVAVGFAHLRRAALRLAAAQAESDPARKQQTLVDALADIDAMTGKAVPGIYVARPIFYRAEIRYALGQREAAMADYRQAIQHDTRGQLRDAALFGLAWCRRDLGDAAGALADFRQLLKDHPQSPQAGEARLMAASLERGAKRYDAALADLDALLASAPPVELASRAGLERGVLLDEMGRPDEAVAAFEDFLRMYPGHVDAPRAYYNLAWTWSGRALAPRRAARAAEREWLEATGGVEPEKLPENERAAAQTLREAFDRADREARGFEDKALAAVGELARRYPDFELLDAALLRQGEIHYDRGEYEEALAAYRAALRQTEARGGENADKIQYRAAWALLRQGEQRERRALANPAGDPAGRLEARAKMEEALKAFEVVATKYPGGALAAESYFRVGESRRRLAAAPEQFRAALLAYDEALHRDPEAAFAPLAVFGRAVCLLSDGRPKEALDAYDRFLAGDPTGPAAQEAHWGRGQSYLDLGMLTEATNAFEKAIALDKDSEAAAKSRYGLGMVDVANKNWEAAQLKFVWVETYFTAYPEWASRALYQAARVSLELGDQQRARQYVDRLLRQFPDSPAVAPARELLTKMDAGN